MPELPEVETVRRALLPQLTGKRIGTVRATVPSLRHPLDAEVISDHIGRRPITDLRRYGKFLVLETSACHALLLHLGMSGAFRIVPPRTPIGPHERLLIRLGRGDELRLIDPRRFSIARSVTLPAAGAIPEELSHLGPDALDDAFDANYLHQRSRKRKTSVKVLLMDQAVVAGPGNIYASEACFRAGIRPNRPSGRLTCAECDDLVKAMKTVLRQAIRKGGTTLRNHRQVDGSEGKFRIHLDVYDRAGTVHEDSRRHYRATAW